MAGRDKIESIAELIERVGQAGDGDAISVGEIVEEIGGDAFPPLLLVPALILVSPASGIPGLSSLGGIIIALIAFQMVIGRKRLWLPGFIRNREISRERLDQATGFLAKPARFVDRITTKRLAALTRWPLSLLPALVCFVTGAVLPLFELVPMSATIAASAVSLFALAMVTRDGLLVVAGFAFLAGAFYLGWLFVS